MSDFPQTYNSEFIDGAIKNFYCISNNVNIVNVDTTGGAVTIGLVDIMSSGVLLYPRRIFVNDTGGNAATNNITIISNNSINNASSFVMSTNGESVELIPCSTNRWLCNSSNSGTSAPPAWSLLGNAGTDPLLNFVGTTDNQPLIFKVNNSLAGQINNANSNVSLGLNALNANPLDNSGGYRNVAIGELALAGNSAGIQNTAVGMYSLNSNNGSDNTAIGCFSLKNNVNGYSNTAVGLQSLFNNTDGIENVAIGLNSMSFNTLGNYNTAVGTGSLSANQANNNTAVGYSSLQTNTTGTSNVAIGYNSLQANITGTSNTAIGFNSLYSNNYGASNVAIGDSALYYNKGSYNTAVGLSAMLNSNNSNFNVAVGGSTLININNGSGNNTAVGMSSGAAIINGANNTFLGSQADASGDFSNCTAIGFNSYVKADNQMQLGNILVSVTTNSISTAIEIATGTGYVFDYTKSANDTVLLNINETVILPNESLIPDGLEIKIIGEGNNLVTSPNNYIIGSYSTYATSYTTPIASPYIAVTLKWSLATTQWYVISSNIGS
jgi:hypothetical protein